MSRWKKKDREYSAAWGQGGKRKDSKKPDTPLTPEDMTADEYLNAFGAGMSNYGTSHTHDGKVIGRRERRKRLTPLAGHELALRRFMVYASWWDEVIEQTRQAAFKRLSGDEQRALRTASGWADDLSVLTRLSGGKLTELSAAFIGLDHYRNCIAQARIVVVDEGADNPWRHDPDSFGPWVDGVMHTYPWDVDHDPETPAEAYILPAIRGTASKYLRGFYQTNARLIDALSENVELLRCPEALSFPSVFVSMGNGCAHVFDGGWAGGPEGTVEAVLASINGPNCEGVMPLSVAAAGGDRKDAPNALRDICTYGVVALRHATCDAQRAPAMSAFKRNRFKRKLRKSGHDLNMRIPDVYTPIRVGRQQTDEAPRPPSGNIVQVHWSHRWDRAGHNKLRVLRGKGQMDPELREKLEKRGGYAFYAPGKRPSRKHRKLLARLGHKQKQRSEWMACKDWFVQSTVCGPEDAPYVPKLRVQAGV
jgi:hypothetical protein